jgi:hypothetical protein
MAKRWIEEVRQRGQLSVFANVNDVWKDAFRRAFILIDMFAVARDLPTLTLGTAPPDPNKPGAQVLFTTFPSTGFSEGNTQFSRRSGDPPDRIAAAFISVPDNPIVRTDVDHRPPRPIGEEPKVLMAAHELIHAFGLENSDHTPDNAPDVFSTQWIPDVGTRPEDDGLHIGQTKTPPFVFSLRIANLIRNNWR